MGDGNELEADTGGLERFVRGLAGGHEHLRAVMRLRHLEVLRPGGHLPGEGLGRAAPALGLSAVLVHGRDHVVDHGDLVRARLYQRHVEGAAEPPRRGVLRLHRRPVRRGERQVVEWCRTGRWPRAASRPGGPRPTGEGTGSWRARTRRARERTSCASSLSRACRWPHGLRVSVTPPSSCSPEDFAVVGALGGH